MSSAQFSTFVSTTKYREDNFLSAWATDSKMFSDDPGANNRRVIPRVIKPTTLIRRTNTVVTHFFHFPGEDSGKERRPTTPRSVWNTAI